MCWGLNTQYFHIVGDGHQLNTRGLAIVRIPDYRWDDHPQYRELIDPGTYPFVHFFIVWGFLLPFLELVCWDLVCKLIFC